MPSKHITQRQETIKGIRSSVGLYLRQSKLREFIVDLKENKKMTEGLLLCLLTLVASGIGTATGFGTSTIMMPVLALFVPIPIALLFVGIIHLCGDVWKVILFKTGFDWKLILGFGLSGIIASFLGASLSLQVSGLPFPKILGVFLILYVMFLFLRHDWSLPKTQGTTVCGGGAFRFVRRFLWCRRSGSRCFSCRI